MENTVLKELVGSEVRVRLTDIHHQINITCAHGEMWIKLHILQKGTVYTGKINGIYQYNYQLCKSSDQTVTRFVYIVTVHSYQAM